MNNNEIFKPENLSVSDIFSFTGIYSIPNYQRQYSWVTENLDELWDDLYESFKSNSNDCYFLGSIVAVDKKNGEHELVDGQQRITTLMIMFNVLYKNFKNINVNNTAILNVNETLLESLVYFNKTVDRLKLQVDPNYDSAFRENITKLNDYSNVKKPTKEEMKKEDPKYKFINTSYFFYHKFKDLEKLDKKNGTNELGNFVNYIMFNTSIIKIICFDQSFAIKLFLVLNDRGLDLSNADIVKSIIYNEFDKDKENYRENDKTTFNTDWKEIETTCNTYDLSMDDFLVLFEYFKLRSNPKKQVGDELKDIITDKNTIVKDFVGDMKKYSDNVKKFFTNTDSVTYSLRYIPWRFYVITSVATAYQVNYEDMDSLLKLLRRFYYISWVGGKTLTSIKNTAFKVIDAIADNKPIEEISKIVNDYILRNKLITSVYETLNGDVYGENFLKPLMLSIEYEVREELSTNFYIADKNIHMDHILPKKYYTKQKEWPYITNKEEVLPYLNKLGNMALLLGVKNEEALNYGFEKKIAIYLGADNKQSGRTSFDTTNWIIDNYDAKDEENSKWDIEHIKARQLELIGKIENMFDISEDNKVDEEQYIPEDEVINSGYFKWKYKGKLYTNASLVRVLLSDYVISKKIKSFEEIDKEVREYHLIPILPLISQNDIENGYTYRKIDGVSFALTSPSQFNKERIDTFLEFFKDYFDYSKDLVKMDE